MSNNNSQEEEIPEEISLNIQSEELLYNILSNHDKPNSKQELPNEMEGSSNNLKPEKNETENETEKYKNENEESKNKNSKSKNPKSKSKNQKSKSKNKNSSKNENSKSKINQQSKSNKEKSRSPNYKSKSPINNKNNKKNIITKKPYIISDIQTTPYKKIKIIINACSFYDEYMMPIWCPKNEYIKFKVEGKWRIDKLYDYTDSKGIPSNHSKGFNYGALIGRIGLGKKFVVVNESCLLVKEEGPLFLKQNLPKNMKIEPEGKLEINIYDADYMDIKDINEKIGWKETGTIDHSNENANTKNNNDKKLINSNNIKNVKMEMEEKGLEKNLRKQFNNLRMNPTMFYEKYIDKKLVETKEFLIKNEKVQRIPLNEEKEYNDLLEKYLNSPMQIQFKQKLNKNNVNENLSKLNENIEFYLFDAIGKTIKSKIILTQKDSPNEVVLHYLLDKKFRTYIFSSHSQFLAVKVLKNYYTQSTLVIMAIVLDKDYS